MTIGLFYLMLSPLPDRYSLDQRWRKLPPKNPHLLGFFRRLLQIHLCLIYFFGGVAKMPGERLVGWFESLARARPATIQRDCTGDTHPIEISVPRRRHRDLPARNQLPCFYLEPENARNLVNGHLCDASRDRTNDGHVSFCVHHDRP